MKKEKLSKYLFCYFTGNEPENESVHFALSDDGYRFCALNKNQPVITQKLGKKCCRDPFILRGENGLFYILATDMRCYDGWNSNNSIVVWESTDLIHWENERIIDFSQFQKTKNANRVWAPQAMFDEEKGMFMLYWSHQNEGDGLSTIPWFAYTKDFKTLETQPDILFRPESGLAAIDGDIIKKDGKYYLFTADEEKDGICLETAEHLSGKYCESKDNKISVSKTKIEGNCCYEILGENKFVIIADRFVDGGYFMQESEDLWHFTEVDESRFSLNHLHPRHGSMLHITDKETKALISAFGIESSPLAKQEA